MEYVTVAYPICSAHSNNARSRRRFGSSSEVARLIFGTKEGESDGSGVVVWSVDAILFA